MMPQRSIHPPSRLLPISVVIPAFNRTDTITRAIKSVNAQIPYLPSETVVVDDGSQDDTAKVAAALGAIVIRHETNKGPGVARTTGIENASFPWIAFLDSDDEWLPNHLEGVWQYSRDHVLVAAPGVMPPTNKVSARIVGNAASKNYSLNKPLDVLEPENRITTPGVLVRTEISKQAGGFSSGFMSEDLDFWIRVLALGSGIALSKPAFICHPSPSSASANRPGMRQAVLDYLDGYTNEPWFDPETVHRTMARHRWDDFRAALSRRDTNAGLRQLLWLIARPWTWLAVIGLLRFRRSARSRGVQFWKQLNR